MAKIVIDARESGTSTGRYIDKLIEHIHIQNPTNDFTILTKAHRIDFVKSIAPSFTVLETPFQEFTFGEQLGFKKQIESLKPDLVHFGMVQQPVLYKGRVVTTMHDLTTLRFRNPSKNPVVYFIKQKIYKYVNITAARKSRVVIAISEYTKQDVVALTGVDPNKIVVTLEAADKISEQPVAYKPLEGKKFIMYVGRPTPHKNLGFLIKVFSELQKTNPNLCLVLAGKKDALYDSHEKNVKQKGIKNVVFTGFISDGELRWLYEHTACYVFPSLSEGFGLPPLEAMMHGAPVASSNATCLPEINGDGAAYFDPRNVGGAVGVLHDIINNKTTSENLKQKGFKQVTKYSWDRTAKQTLEVYARALS